MATSYTYDPIGRLASPGNNRAGNAAYNNSYGFAYSPASQLTTLTRSNNAFVFAGIYNVNRPYAVNGLNQYTTAGPASFTYDANGDLIYDGSTSFLYDGENRLVGAGGLKNAALRYDPLGRLYEVAGPSGTTRFLYDGDVLVAEYDASGNLLRRYVHGADMKADDPIAWYEGSSFTSSSERFMRPDWQGSIGLVTDNAGGTIIAANTYDEYGIPGSANAGRFQYTGQAWMPELGMYYYKARMYSPTLGRFMQTDPIGYKDDVNLYAYVANDPVDHVDASGMAGCDSTVSGANCSTLMKEQAQALKDVRAERAAIGRIEKGGQLSKGDSAVKSQIGSVFGSTSASTLGKVDGMLGNAENVLADNGDNYNYHTPSAGEVASAHVNPNSTVAFTHNGSATINVMPQYYREPGWHMEGTLIHEPTHIFGASDNAYRIGPDSTLGSGWQSYRNYPPPLPWRVGCDSFYP